MLVMQYGIGDGRRSLKTLCRI